MDKHGINVLYSHADSSFSPGHSDGCRYLMQNGAFVSGKTRGHSTIDDSTTAAEVTECWLAANDVSTFRQLYGEMGFEYDEPTTIYQDNQPAIAVATGERNLTSRMRHVQIRTGKLAEYIMDQEVALQWLSTVQLIADLGTKFHPAPRFEFLRDLMNGYALIRAANTGRDLPLLVVSLEYLTKGAVYWNAE